MSDSLLPPPLFSLSLSRTRGPKRESPVVFPSMHQRVSRSMMLRLRAPSSSVQLPSAVTTAHSQARAFHLFWPTGAVLQQQQRNRSKRRGSTRVLPSTTYNVSPLNMSSSSSGLPGDVGAGASNSGGGGGAHAFRRMLAEETAALPALRCPGGPRLKAEGIKRLYKVPHAGILAKYDQRFMLNLKLTHQIVSHLSRSTLKTGDKVLLELGPGAGSLTRSLLTRPCVGVLGIECDERFNSHLEQIRGYTKGKFHWVNADVLQVNELGLMKKFFPSFVRQNQRHRAGSSETRREAKGFEGAPLRSSQRERLLRQRQTRYGGFHRSSGRGGGGGGGEGEPFCEPASSAAASRRRDPLAATSPNPALDVTDHWWADGDAKVEVVANLPFSVITELLMRYAVDCSRRANLFSFGRVPLHVFVQREVADRIVAPAGSLHFSRLSVLTQAFFHVKVQQVFAEWTYYPKTEVLGAMLTLEPRAVPLGWSADGGESGHPEQPSPPPVDGASLIHFTDLVMKAGQRGASIHKALSTFMPPEVVQFMLQSVRMDGAMTVLDLSVEELVRMTGLWQAFLTVSQQQQQQQQHQSPPS